MHKLSVRGIYVSQGSACDSKKEKENYALRAIGLSANEMKSSLRISLPANVSKQEVDYFVKVLTNLL